jgi:hypothetical protein
MLTMKIDLASYWGGCNMSNCLSFTENSTAFCGRETGVSGFDPKIFEDFLLKLCSLVREYRCEGYPVCVGRVAPQSRSKAKMNRQTPIWRGRSGWFGAFARLTSAIFVRQFLGGEFQPLGMEGK